MASRHGDSAPPVNNTPATDATKSAAGTTPVIGSCYNGTIDTVEADGTYTIRVDAPRQTIKGARLAVPVLGGLMGFNVRSKLTQGTKVKVAYGHPSFIYAVIPENNGDWKNAKNRSGIWGATIEAETGDNDTFSDITDDMVPGEFEISNMFGVAMQFLTNILRMTAADRAAVEVHLINQMVRLISSQYQHISGIGDELIFDHGRPTLERGWSSYRHEVLGKLKLRDPIAEMAGDAVDREKLEADRVTAVGRHRLVEFIGFAGDFIHSFVTDPAETLVKMTVDDARAGAGKSLVHRNSDGSLLFQSVADIRLERVVRIPVPVRIASHEDQTITAEREYETLDAEFLRLPDFGSPEKMDAYKMAYHLRLHSRWLSRYHAFARMLQLGSEYKLESEALAQVPSWTNLEEDKTRTNAGTTYYDAYASITILRDGSIVMHDGYGSTVMMSNGNVRLSAARHLDLEAAGDIRLVAGGSVFVKAKRNIEMSAAVGGLILHSYAWMRMLCEKGSVWLRTGAVSGVVPEPHPDGGPVPEVADQDPDDLAEHPGVPMLIESTGGSSVLRSHGGIVMMVDGTPVDANDNSKNITIFTKGDAKLTATRSIDVATPGRLGVAGRKAIGIATNCITTDASEMYATGGLAYKGGKFFAALMETFSLKSEIIRNRKIGPITPIPDPQPKETLKQHFNHTIPLPDDEVIEIIPNTNVDGTIALASSKRLAAAPPPLPWVSPSAGPLWSFSPAAEYLWDDRDDEPGALAETLTQQYLRLDVTMGEDQWGGNGYEPWAWNRAISGPRTRPTGGFGFGSVLYRASDEGESLREPSTTEPSEPSTTEPSELGAFEVRWLRNKNFNFLSLKRPE